MRLFPSSIRTFIPFAVAVSIAAAMANSLTEISLHHWYAALRKPPWSIPVSAFSPIWTCLFASMAAAAWLVYRKSGNYASVKGPLTLWGIQLILNAFWPGFFFALRNPLMGAIEMMLGLGAAVATTAVFIRRDRRAGLMMIPPTIWVAYAAVLSWTIWLKNN